MSKSLKKSSVGWILGLALAFPACGSSNNNPLPVTAAQPAPLTESQYQADYDSIGVHEGYLNNVGVKFLVRDETNLDVAFADAFWDSDSCDTDHRGCLTAIRKELRDYISTAEGFLEKYNDKSSDPADPRRRDGRRHPRKDRPSTDDATRADLQTRIGLCRQALDHTTHLTDFEMLPKREREQQKLIKTMSDFDHQRERQRHNAD